MTLAIGISPDGTSIYLSRNGVCLVLTEPEHTSVVQKLSYLRNKITERRTCHDGIVETAAQREIRRVMRKMGKEAGK